MSNEKKLIRMLIAVICWLCAAGAVTAENGTVIDVPVLPAGVMPLPEPRPGRIAGIIINSKNSPGYKKIIPPEIYDLVRSGTLFMDSAARLQYVWRRDDEWEKKSGVLKEQHIALKEDGTLGAKIAMSQGFLFGPGTELLSLWRSELESEGKRREHFQRELAYRVLWNVNSSFVGLGMFDLAFSLHWIRNGKAYRRVAGSLTRAYPSLLDSSDKSEQLFRERLRFTEPEMLKTFSLLTFRFKGSDEDMVWIRSPASGKVRQLTGSNRSDSLITSSLSADDLLCWSGDIKSSSAKLENSGINLAPFASAVVTELSSTPDSCFNYSEQGDRGGFDFFHSPWNFESRKFPDGGGWIPTKTVYVPRKLWRIELSSKDPYSLYGRQILYVDAVMQLPVYKIVYNRAGIKWKTLICSFGMAVAPDRSKKLPYLSTIAVFDHISEKGFSLHYSASRWCSAFPEDISMDDFTVAGLKQRE